VGHRMRKDVDRTGASAWLTAGRAGLASQAGLWFAFVFGYQLVQAGAGRDRGQALANGLGVARLEGDLVHGLVELRLQELARDSGILDAFVAFTYWSSEFAVVALALLWVYLRRPWAFPRFRNTLIVTNLIALLGFYAFPTAPPRKFATLGFVDTMKDAGTPGHGRGLLPLPSNQYAAMPSLHSADAVIVGVGLALLVRSRPLKAILLLWPLAVWFSVLATGNHFWLDIVGGVVVAAMGGLAVTALGRRRRLRPTSLPAPPRRATRAATAEFSASAIRTGPRPPEGGQRGTANSSGQLSSTVTGGYLCGGESASALSSGSCSSSGSA
jgi:membrane-associated phospholipid phosphatase